MAKRIIIIFVVCALIGGGYWFYLSKQQLAQTASGDAPQTTASLHEGHSIEDSSEAQGSPNIGGSLAGLTNQDSKKVTDADFKGKKLLIFFGFTNCPDICPVSMAIVTEVMNQLDEQNINNVQPVLVTVDPERDTPAVLKKYIADYHPSFVGLTGTPEELAKVQGGYKVYAEAQKEEEPASGGDGDSHGAHGNHGSHGYNVNHSDLIYLMDDKGKYLYHFNNSNAPEDIVDYIATH